MTWVVIATWDDDAGTQVEALGPFENSETANEVADRIDEYALQCEVPVEVGDGAVIAVRCLNGVNA